MSQRSCLYVTARQAFVSRSRCRRNRVQTTGFHCLRRTCACDSNSASTTATALRLELTPTPQADDCFATDETMVDLAAALTFLYNSVYPAPSSTRLELVSSLAGLLALLINTDGQIPGLGLSHCQRSYLKHHCREKASRNYWGLVRLSLYVCSGRFLLTPPAGHFPHVRCRLPDSALAFSLKRCVGPITPIQKQVARSSLHSLHMVMRSDMLCLSPFLTVGQETVGLALANKSSLSVSASLSRLYVQYILSLRASCPFSEKISGLDLPLRHQTHCIPATPMLQVAPGSPSAHHCTMFHS